MGSKLKRTRWRSQVENLNKSNSPSLSSNSRAFDGYHFWNSWSAGTGWSVLESADGIKTIYPSPTKNNIEVKEEPLEGAIEQISQPISNTEEAQMSMIGSEVETISGESGVLICSSGMGLSPMDLFNDIFTSRTDLTNFLNDYNCKESDNISLRSVFSSDWDPYFVPGYTAPWVPMLELVTLRHFLRSIWCSDTKDPLKTNKA